MPCKDNTNSRNTGIKQEAESKVILARSHFFGDFSVFACKFEKISFLYAKIPYAARQHSQYAPILAIKRLCRLLFSVFRAIYFLRLWAMTTSPHSTETFSADFNLKRLNPWLNFMFPKTASGSIGLLLLCISPWLLISSSRAFALYALFLWLTSMVRLSAFPL